ncbi:ferritin-like domain-containing protein [Cupriavidus gilardii]|uniref:ferritin-like domain-containing protein n=1 Tax=Cupriavidus gilardii TaxID=82541 RepID=UPI0021B17707|nr:ferritin-like domain-containing protein [Cupriavidus gilardii]MCT9124187.1 ferritin-like domain-containing protein [Cupriavidus gilardii]UXC38185.1 ferritin-like domain-containing protein [Cupriavidus gilardii]
MQQTTQMGVNRTGAQMSPIDTETMERYADNMGPDSGIDDMNVPAESQPAAEMRAQYIDEADPVGSVPLPGTLKGAMSTTVDKLTGNRPEVLIDKLGERLAFERTGTRLYELMIAKCKEMDTSAVDPDVLGTLMHFHDEEAEHFAMVDETMRAIGADPTAVTPCADVAGVTAMGVLQTIADPRTNFAQCLNALLTAEMTDNAGWELLIKLATETGHTEMAQKFQQALTEEEQHMATIRQWLERAVITEAT